MAREDVEGIESTVQETHTWLNELAEELHTTDRQRAYLVLRAFLHALRDQLTVDEAAHFSAQLPMLVKGIYYDGWKPAATPERLRDRSAFLDRIRTEASFAAEMDPGRAVEAAGKVVSRHMTRGQVEQLLASLPRDIRGLLAA